MMYSFSLISLTDLEKINYSGKYPGMQANWIIDWYKTFEKESNHVLGSRKQPYIVAAYTADKLVAIVPFLGVTRNYLNAINVRFLEFLGQQWSGMGYDIISLRTLDENFCKELIKWAKSNLKFHYLFLKYLPKNSAFRNKLKLFKYAGAPYVNPTSHESYDEFSQKVYTRKFREDLRRTLRRIKKDGYEMSIHKAAITEESLQSIRQVSQSKITDGKADLYSNNKKEEFHLKMYRNFTSQVLFIKFNEKIVAYGTSIDFNGVRIGIDAAFDREYRRYGVGIHCVDTVVRQSFRDGIKKLSFGMGMDQYKFQFTNQIEEFYMCFDYKPGWKSLLALPYFLYKLKTTHKNVSERIEKFLGANSNKKTKPQKKPVSVPKTKRHYQHIS